MEDSNGTYRRPYIKDTTLYSGELFSLKSIELDIHLTLDHLPRSLVGSHQGVWMNLNIWGKL